MLDFKKERELTLESFYKVLAIIKNATTKSGSIVLQGSSSLYLQNIIKRNPNDIDILFTGDLSLEERNNLWYEIIQNFDIIKYEAENELIKTCLISFNSEIFKIDSIVSKTVNKSSIIRDPNSNLQITNYEYCYVAKLAYLAYVLTNRGINAKSINKINSTLSDLSDIGDHFSLKFETIKKIIIEIILANIPCEVIPLKEHYYWNLLELKNTLQINGFFIKSKVAEILNKIKQDDLLKSMCKIIDDVFKIKNYFIYELFLNGDLIKSSCLVIMERLSNYQIVNFLKR